MTVFEVFQRLGLALAIGLMMGIERGWMNRARPIGAPAGIRTFALIGLTGGVLGVLALKFGALVLAAGIVALAGLVVTLHVVSLKDPSETGTTTDIAQVLAFGLGALAAEGEMAAAAASGVVATALLNSKETLHAWLRRLDKLELGAAIRLLVISVVLLPLLPNEGYGPGGALNPFKIWVLVVMVASISFCGYFAIKIAGPALGCLFTGVCGGLASSTALTVSFSKMGKANPGMQTSLAAGVAVANATMYGRLWVIVLVLNRAMAWDLIAPLAAMMVAGYLSAFLLWKTRGDEAQTEGTLITNPFELGVAIKFAVLLTLVMLASKLLQGAVGSSGLYILAAVAGLNDVDAMALSMSDMGGVDVALKVAATAVTITAFVNTGVKAALVGSICGGVMAKRITAVVVAVIIAGCAGLAGQWAWM